MDQFKDPLGFLNNASPEQRQGFEIGMVYADMLAGNKGPWIISDGPRHLIYDMASRLGMVATILYDSINTPEPKISVTVQPLLRLV